MIQRFGVDPLVLYADDNAFERQNFISLAKQIDPAIRVKLFENGMQLANYLIETKDQPNLPELIVLDLYMPLWNGLDTYKALKSDKLYRKIPISMLTASSDPNDVQLIKANKVQHCLVKPLNKISMSLLLGDLIKKRDGLLKE